MDFCVFEIYASGGKGIYESVPGDVVGIVLVEGFGVDFFENRIFETVLRRCYQEIGNAFGSDACGGA